MGNAGVKVVGNVIGVNGYLPESPGGAVGTVHGRVPGGCQIRVLYPAAANAAGGAKRNGYVRDEVVRNASFMFKNVRNTKHHLLHASEPRAGRLPVVIFSHGLKGNCDVYSKFCSDLASFGFVVVALEHEDGSASYALAEGEKRPIKENNTLPAGSNQVDFRAPFLAKRRDEVSQVVDFLKANCNNDGNTSGHALSKVLRSIDVSKMFLGGHSFGACSTVTSISDAALRSHFLAIFLLDIWSEPIPEAVVQAGVQLPCISLLSEHFKKLPAANRTAELFHHSTNCKSYYLKGTVHEDFSDFPWLLSAKLMKKINKQFVSRAEEQHTAVIESVSAHLLSFCDASKSDPWESVIAKHPTMLPFPEDQPVEAKA